MELVFSTEAIKLEETLQDTGCPIIWIGTPTSRCLLQVSASPASSAWLGSFYKSQGRMQARSREQ